VVIRHSHLACLQNKTNKEQVFLCFFKELKVKHHQSNGRLFLWIKVDRGSWFHLINLYHKHDGEDSTNDKLKA
jgi:hypothetical protein